MLNLLVMPLGKAKAMIPAWNHTEFFNGLFSALGCILALLAAGMLLDIMLWRRHHQWDSKEIGKMILVLSMLLLGLAPIVGNFHVYEDTTRDRNIGAITNVSAYYKMKHLRKIYYKLPCKKLNNRKICKTNSLSKASSQELKYRKLKKHTFTKKQATIEYNKLKHAYRKPVPKGDTSTETTVNDTTSLHPTRPHWWNYIWG